jgi:hypothetical protein
LNYGADIKVQAARPSEGYDAYDKVPSKRELECESNDDEDDEDRELAGIIPGNQMVCTYLYT